MQARMASPRSAAADGLAVHSGPLPAGHHSLTREAVVASQRGRLIDAMARAVAEHGYSDTTVAHVVALAGVSRKTFYEHFSDKQDCLLALYDTAIAYTLGRIDEALGDARSDEDARRRVAVSVKAFLAVLAEQPAFSRTIILEVQAAGPQALRRHRRTLGIFARRYEDLNALARKQDPSIPPLTHEIALALIGALVQLAAIYIADDRTAELPKLGRPLTGFVLSHVAPASGTLSAAGAVAACDAAASTRHRR
jgi:AcrR family transcriptional regulator